MSLFFLMRQGAQKWLYEIISCAETQSSNTFFPENGIFCADEFQICGVNRSFFFFSSVDLHFEEKRIVSHTLPNLLVYCGFTLGNVNASFFFFLICVS